LVYLATAEAKDEEMKKRISRHRVQRRSRRWLTVEEPLEVVWQLKEFDESIGGGVVDLGTLWGANGLPTDQRGTLENQGAELIEEIPLFPFHFLTVSNEVGLGLVPDHPLGREYRDLLGSINQQLAKACKEVLFLAAGLPMKLKG